MGKDSQISWCDATWGVVAGCTPVSPGCEHCYSARLCATRFAHLPWANGLATTNSAPKKSGCQSYRWTGEVVCRADQLDVPLHWKAPKRIFVGDRGDLFHERVSNEFIAAVMGVAGACQQHTFLFLTKRPARMGDWFEWVANEPTGLRSRKRWPNFICADRGSTELLGTKWGRGPLQVDGHEPWPLPNAWLGTSVCAKPDLPNIDHLRLVPAAKRFLSIEPLIDGLGSLDLTGIDWVICGGESGPGARPMHPDWVRDIRDQCVRAGVPFYFKQWGQWMPVDKPWEQDNVKPLDRGHERWMSLTEGQVFHDRDVWRMCSVGAKVAGRVLDGRTWEEGPRRI